MIERIVSGGQTGVDLAALTTATSLDIPTSGWAESEWSTEDGTARWLEDYGLRPCPRPGYPARTEANVRDSDATLIITHEPGKLTGGSYQTMCIAESLDKPLLIARVNMKSGKFTLDYPSGTKGLSFKSWLAISNVRTLNVAGPRESKSPGIFERAGEVLMDLLGGLA